MVRQWCVADTDRGHFDAGLVALSSSRSVTALSCLYLVLSRAGTVCRHSHPTDKSRVTHDKEAGILIGAVSLAQGLAST